MTKRNLLLASLLLVFGFGVLAPSAMAQSLPVGTTSTINTLRPNSNGDALGPVTLTIGTSTAGVPAIATGQIITVTYSQAIVGASGVSAAPVADFCTSVPAAMCGDFTFTASGNTLTMVATAVIDVAAGNYIVIHGFRAPTVGLGAGTQVTALVYASNTISGVPTTQPITFGNGTNSITIPVANVPSTTAVTDSVPTTPGSASTCIGLTTPPGPYTWTTTITENWAGAWSSEADETNLAGYLVTNGSNIAITVSGIPDGVTVAPTAVSNGGHFAPWTAAGAAVTWSAPTPTTYTSAADGSSATFVYTILNTERGVLLSTPLNQPVESATFTYTISSTGALHTGLGPMQVSVTLVPPPASAAPFVYPAFTYPVFGLAEEEPGTPQTVFTFIDCVTHLLWPYVTNYNGGAAAGPLGNWDTAIEVMNGTSLPYSTVTVTPVAPQKGSCTFYYYSAGTSTSPGLGTQASPIVPPTTTPYLNSGGIFAFMLSNGTYGAPGLVGGYAVATCGFQNAAGYGAIVANANGLGVWDLYANYLAGYLPN